MKIQIDTANKSIKLEEPVNLGCLMKWLKKIFPDGEWDEYLLETSVSYTIDNVPPIQPYIYQPPGTPSWQEPFPNVPTITYDKDGCIYFTSMF